MLEIRGTGLCTQTSKTIRKTKCFCNGLKRRLSDVILIKMHRMKKDTSISSINSLRILTRIIGFTTTKMTLKTHSKERFRKMSTSISMPCLTNLLVTRGLIRKAASTTLNLKIQNLITSGSKISFLRIASNTQ